MTPVQLLSHQEITWKETLENDSSGPFGIQRVHDEPGRLFRMEPLTWAETPRPNGLLALLDRGGQGER